MASYNYDKFSEDQYDLVNFDGPAPGTRAPDFQVSDLAGGTRRLLDFPGRFLVLEFGSITCPLFQSRRRGMSELVARYPEVSFVVLYVREAHPGGNIPAHGTLADKRRWARELQASLGETREILIDDMDGTVHQAYGGFPNPVFIINRQGCIVYRSVWSNPSATAAALARLMAGKPAPREGLFRPARPPVLLDTLKRAGKGAARDFFLSLPKMVWKNLVRTNLRILLGKPGRVGPDSSC